MSIGIVHVDHRSKKPHILEAVPWRGVTSTPFSERLQRRDAVKVVIIPLKYSNSDSSRHRERRVEDRVNSFAIAAQQTTKIPTSVKVGKV